MGNPSCWEIPKRDWQEDVRWKRDVTAISSNVTREEIVPYMENLWSRTKKKIRIRKIHQEELKKGNKQEKERDDEVGQRKEIKGNW